MPECKTIYDMNLHGIKSVYGFHITRVPGGWIYESVLDQCIFVPFSDEFKLSADMIGGNPDE